LQMYKCRLQHIGSPMNRLTFQSSRATLRLVKNGAHSMAEATYSGLLCRDVFLHLARGVLQETDCEPVFVARLDRLLIVMHAAPPMPSGMYRPGSASCAVVLREDQYALFRPWFVSAADQGVLRAIFLTSEIAIAYRWAALQMQ
jgi:hypothetical protein